MTGWFIFLAYLAAVNPARIRPHLAGGEERGQLTQLAIGAATVLTIGLGLVLAADRILDALDITDETWRLAAGVVCGLVGARALAAPGSSESTMPAGSGLVPIAFPLLLTPQLAMLAVLFGATESLAMSWGGMAVGVAVGAAGGRLRLQRPMLWRATAQLTAAVLVLVGIALVVAGIRDV